MPPRRPSASWRQHTAFSIIAVAVVAGAGVPHPPRTQRGEQAAVPIAGAATKADRPLLLGGDERGLVDHGASCDAAPPSRQVRQCLLQRTSGTAASAEVNTGRDPLSATAESLAAGAPSKVPGAGAIKESVSVIELLAPVNSHGGVDEPSAGARDGIGANEAGEAGEAGKTGNHGRSGGVSSESRGTDSGEATSHHGGQSGADGSADAEHGHQGGREGGIGHGHADGRAEHAGHGGGHQESATAVALSLTLLGMVACVMSLFYLVNFPDRDIQRATWNILSSSLSIFGAVLCFSAIKGVTMMLFQEPIPSHHGGPPDANALAFHFVRLLLVTASFHVLLYTLRERQLQTIGSMGAHVVGFALIDFFGTWQQFAPFSTSPLHCFAQVLLSAAIILGCIATATYVRERLPPPWPGSEWAEQCKESEDDAAGLSLGLLVCQVIKFAITGHLAPIHGSPKEKTAFDLQCLLFTSIGCAGLVGGANMWRRSLEKQGHEAGDTVHEHSGESADGAGDNARGVDLHAVAGRSLRRCASMLVVTASMTLGWCLLFCGQWFFWRWTGGQGVGEGDVMSARMIMVLGFGVGGFSVIIMLDWIADHGWVDRSLVNGLIDAIGLLLGLSWEAAVTSAVEGLGTAVPGRTLVVDLTVDVGLCIATIPAWALYVLPQSLKYVSEKSGPGSPRSLPTAGNEDVAISSKVS